MSGYLFTLAVGPVQDFIAAARRTRDLWFGSYVLSEISKAAAKAISDAGAELIFPAPEDPAQLEPDSELSVANKILAVMPPDSQSSPAELAALARRAAEARWLEFARTAREFVGDQAIRLDIWEDQINDVIEFYAAWLPWPRSAGETPLSYQKAREKLELLMAGRKALRDFRPARGRQGVPKSSLDGARESVLAEGLARSPVTLRRLRIKRGEQLDAVGLVKRCAKAKGEDGAGQFVSVSRVAADAWIRKQALTEKGKQRLDDIKLLCHPDFATPISKKHKQYTHFPFEGTVLYPSRLDELLQDPDYEEHWDRIRQIREKLSFNDQPTPYLAILTADGDRMGKVLSALQSAEAHRRFSRQLSRFAGEVRAIVEEEHHGCLVYSGGDDVLAFLPVDSALRAAKDLHKRFAEIMEDVAREVPDVTIRPTLSVGIAIGHFLEPLGDLLQYAREAERAAKRRTAQQAERNGLAIHFHTRGGSPLRWRERWDNKDPVERLEGWVKLFREDKLPDKLAYDMHALALDYASWANAPVELLKSDARRLLSRKGTGGERLEPEVIASLLDRIDSADALDLLARELLVAAHLAGEMVGGSGENTPTADGKGDDQA